MMMQNQKMLPLVLAIVVLAAVGTVIFFSPNPAGLPDDSGAVPGEVSESSLHSGQPFEATRSDNSLSASTGDVTADGNDGDLTDDAENRGGEVVDGNSGDQGSTTTLTANIKANGNGEAIAGGSGGGGGSNAGNRTGERGSGTSDSSSAFNGTSGAGSGYGNVGENGVSEEPEDATEEAVVVGGIVYRDTEPIEGARIQLIRSQDGATRYVLTTEDGGYQFEGVNPGTHSLVLQEPKSGDARRILDIQPYQDRLNEDFVVPPMDPLTGIVENSSTAEGIPGVRLDIWRGADLTGVVYTNQDGNFELPALNPGSYRLAGSKEGFSNEETSFALDKNGTDQPLRLVMEPSGLLNGRVVSPSGAGVEGAIVSLVGQSHFNDPYAQFGVKTTGPGGSFTFSLPGDELQSGGFRIGAYAEGYIPAYSEPLTPGAIDSEERIPVRLTEGIRAMGRVVSSGEGEESADEPVLGAEATIVSGYANSGAIYQRVGKPFPSSSTGGDGTFELFPVEPGASSIRINAEGFIPKEVSWTAAMDDNPHDFGDIVVESDGETKKGRIFGVIVDETGKGLQNHTVLARHVSTSEDTNTSTDSKGSFIFDDLEEGKYLIATNGSTLRGDQYITMDQRYPFASTGGEQIFLVYDMGQSIRMKVTDQNGNGITNYKVGVHVRTNGAEGHGGYQETFGQGFERNIQSPSGETVIENVMAGNAHLTITSSDFGTAERKNQLVPVGGQLDLGEIQLEGGAQVTGSIVSAETGYGVAGVSVKLIPPQGAGAEHPLVSLQFRTVTNDTGDFSFTGVTAENFDLLMERQGFVTRRLRNQQMEGDNTDLGDLEMVGGAVMSGRILDPEDKPVTDARFTAGDTTFFSDREGNFYTDNITPGQVEVRVFDPTGTLTTEPNPLEFNVEPSGLTGLLIKMVPES